MPIGHLLPPILSIFEKVRILVDPLHCRINFASHAPVPDVFRVIIAHRRLAGRVELVVVAVLEEVDLAVASPHESGVQVERDSGKSICYRFWVAGLKIIFKSCKNVEMLQFYFFRFISCLLELEIRNGRNH